MTCSSRSSPRRKWSQEARLPVEVEGRGRQDADAVGQAGRTRRRGARVL